MAREIDLSESINPLVEGTEIDASNLVSPLASPPPLVPGAGLPNGEPVYAPGQSPIDPTLVTDVPSAPVPVAVPETTSESSTTTGTSSSKTSQERSPATIAAEENAAKADSEYKKAIEAEQRAPEETAKAEADLAEKDNMAIATYGNALAEVQQENQASLQKDLGDIDLKVAELANYKPETFWGSKSAADKVMSAISVGLGSFAQATLGSGQNIGAVLLDRQMQEFDRNQTAQYNAKLQGIQGLRASFEQKQELAKDAEKILDSQKLAARAQIQAQLGRGVAMAKTATVKAALSQKLAKYDQESAKMKMEQAAKYEQRITSNMTNNVVKRTATLNRINGVSEDKHRSMKMNDGIDKMATARSEVASGLKLLNDPNKSDEEKLQIAQGMVKAMNLTAGTVDAVGAEEVKRLAGELVTSTEALGKGAVYGGGVGATAGAGLGGIPTLGFGAPIGAAVGAGLGGLAGIAGAAISEANTPGGIKFSPDIKMFTQRAANALQKMDGSIARQSRLQQLLKQGLTVPQANAVIDSEQAK